MLPVPVSFKYSGCIENCTDGEGRAESVPLLVHERSSNSFLRSVVLSVQLVFDPVAFRSVAVTFAPSGVPVEGPPLVP
jgi:hypothetical protein